MPPKRTAPGKGKGGRPSTGKINFNLKNKIVDEEILSSSDDESGDERLDADSEDEEEQETSEQKRRRLASEYIRSMKTGVHSDDNDDHDEEDDEEDGVGSGAFASAISAELRRSRLQAQGRYFRSCARQASRLDGNAVAEGGRVMGGHQLSVTCVALSTDERTVFSGSKDNSVLQWDAETGHKTVLRPRWDKNSGGRRAQAHNSEVLAVAVTVDGKYCVSGGRDCKIRVHDTRIGQEIKVLSGHRDAVTSLCFQAGGSNSATAGTSSSSAYALLSGSLDRCVKHWDLSEMGYIETLFGHQDGVNCVASGVDGNRPVTGGSDHTVRLWRVQEESHLVYRGQHSIVDAVSALTQETFVSGDESGSVCLWKVSQKRPLAQLEMAHGACGLSGEGVQASSNAGSGRWISSLSALHMSDIFASGSNDGYVRLWSVAAEGSTEFRRDLVKQAAAIPVPGFINGLVLTPRLLVAGTGREHRLGRWWCLPGNRNKVVVMRLPELDAEADDDDDDDDDDDNDDVDDESSGEDSEDLCEGEDSGSEA